MALHRIALRPVIGLGYRFLCLREYIFTSAQYQFYCKILDKYDALRRSIWLADIAAILIILLLQVPDSFLIIQ